MMQPLVIVLLIGAAFLHASWNVVLRGRQDRFLSIMLGVRRPGVTEALNIMEGLGLIKASRGAVRVLDRPGVMVCANGSYGIAEVEYERLML